MSKLMKPIKTFPLNTPLFFKIKLNTFINDSALCRSISLLRNSNVLNENSGYEKRSTTPDKNTILAKSIFAAQVFAV